MTDSGLIKPRYRLPASRLARKGRVAAATRAHAPRVRALTSGGTQELTGRHIEAILSRESEVPLFPRGNWVIIYEYSAQF